MTYSTAVRRNALDLLERGWTLSAVARVTGVQRSTIRAWRELPGLLDSRGECPLCDDAALDGEAYSALLGFYLGDGCISKAKRYYSFRVTCDDKYPGIIADVSDLLGRVRPGGRSFLVPREGCTDVHANWKHWPCLFPQHGAGPKHEREIRLESWQRSLVSDHPAPFLRGLFHSDGSRFINWTVRRVAGQPKRFSYPRWQFVNASADIRSLCCWALDLSGVTWRQSAPRVISVSRREAVAQLDALIGLKS